MVSVIIGAAGESTRFGINKMHVILGGMPLLMRSLYPFQMISDIDEIILVINQNEISSYESLKKSFPKISKIIPGGKTRQESISLGVKESLGDICLVHNGANPLVSKEEIIQVILAVRQYDAAFVGRKVSSTLWEINDEKIVNSIERKMVYEAETPQGFKKNLYLKAITKSNIDFTDEMGLLNTIGVKGKIIKASNYNRKITTPIDLEIAETFLKKHIRSGIGHDSHKFQKNSKKPLIIGGVEIPHKKSFKSNSDGDVLIHSICNAIGTAIGEGSLSRYADKMCAEGITDSRKYLEHITTNMRAFGYVIGNIAISIEGKEPPLEIHISEMKKNIAHILQINPFQIGIAVTSGEKLTSFGKGEGIQCFTYIQLIKT